MSVAMESAAAIVQHPEWQAAVDMALQQTSDVVERSKGADLVFLFANAVYADAFPEMVKRVREATGTSVLVGCSGGGVIGPSTEVEGRPALSLLVLALPGVKLFPVYVDQETLEGTRASADWHNRAEALPAQVNGWFVFADPYRLDCDAFIESISTAYPSMPVIGGLASGDHRTQRTHVFLNGEVYDQGAVGVGIGGAYEVRTVVSQGAEPIGQPWTITSAERHLVQTIGQRPALDVLRETIQSLTPEMRERAQRNLLVGLVMDEYRDEFRRGDFVIRNLIGADPNTGIIAIGDQPRVGQTIQFQLRDARAADDELKEMLARTRETLEDASPVAAVLCSCNGRGQGLFGISDHDAGLVDQELGLKNVAGFFCNGEIGPVGGRTYLHGFTASIGLIVPRTES
jgi:small ligand-binding sensory domain FIST